MKEYEQISEKCKMKWNEGFNLTKEKYSQVSGYIFNDNNQLLIVRDSKEWTIPGGNPEKSEKPLETLEREIEEEANIKLSNINYLGAVEVIENNETYYQLRFTARVSKIMPFKMEWETSERKFVDLIDLDKYITWATGITFNAQIVSARKFWDI